MVSSSNNVLFVMVMFYKIYCRHLKLEILLAIPASNDKQFSRLRVTMVISQSMVLRKSDTGNLGNREYRQW